jgi:hypothetical protein
MPVIKVVTAFTIAHSITLSLAGGGSPAVYQMPRHVGSWYARSHRRRSDLRMLRPAHGA